MATSVNRHIGAPGRRLLVTLLALCAIAILLAASQLALSSTRIDISAYGVKSDDVVLDGGFDVYPS